MCERLACLPLGCVKVRFADFQTRKGGGGAAVELAKCFPVVCPLAEEHRNTFRCFINESLIAESITGRFFVARFWSAWQARRLVARAAWHAGCVCE